MVEREYLGGTPQLIAQECEWAAPSSQSRTYEQTPRASSEFCHRYTRESRRERIRRANFRYPPILASI